MTELLDDTVGPSISLARWIGRLPNLSRAHLEKISDAGDFVAEMLAGSSSIVEFDSENPMEEAAWAALATGRKPIRSLKFNGIPTGDD